MKEWYLRHKEPISYAFWCIMTTLVSWTAYTVFAYLFGLTETLEATVIALIANILSWICAVTFSFVANKIRVFESKSWRPRVVLPEAIKFYSTRAAVGFVETGLATLMVLVGLDIPLFGVDGLLSKMIVTPIIILMNYLCGKFFVFRKKKETKEN